MNDHISSVGLENSLPYVLVFLVEKWLVSRFSGSKEADLHFSLGSFSGHYLVSSDDQSAWSIYTKYSLDDVVFVL